MRGGKVNKFPDLVFKNVMSPIPYATVPAVSKTTSNDSKSRESSPITITSTTEDLTNDDDPPAHKYQVTTGYVFF